MPIIFEKKFGVNTAFIEETEELYECIFCHVNFEKGQVYQKEDKFYEAKRMMNDHMVTHDVVKELIGQSKSATGLTDIQEILIPLMAQKKTDEEIAQLLKITPSTVRNHRFRLREKEKKARNFLRIMDALHEEEENLIKPHFQATMQDDRYHMEKEDEEKLLATFFDENGKLKAYPAKEKKKLVILRKISTFFTLGRVYNEKEVNLLLRRIYDDHVTLRRALIEYGFLDRNKDGSIYTRT